MTKSSYMLRQFTSAKDKDFVEALSVYSKSFRFDVRTDSNEITFWLENYEKRFQDKFYVVGFYANDILVGYSEFVYLIKEWTLIFDYVAIDEKYRKHNVFFEFAEHIRAFVESEKLMVKYAVTEVGYMTKGENPSEYSRALFRLLKMVGGRVAKAPYYVPRLGLENLESEMLGNLVIFAFPETDQLKRETYLSIVHSIFYKYYYPWYSIYKKNNVEYKQHLDTLFSRIEKETKSSKNIALNGERGLFDEKGTLRTALQTKLFNFIFPSLLFVVLMTYLLIRMAESSNLSVPSLVAIYLVSLISFFSLLGLFSKTARLIFQDLIGILKLFSRKPK